MPTIASTVQSKLSFPSNPKVTNFPVTLANIEEQHQMTLNTKQFLIRSRNGSQLRVAFSTGETSTNYLTIKSGTVYFQQSIDFSGKVYFQTSQNADVVEILEWY